MRSLYADVAVGVSGLLFLQARQCLFAPYTLSTTLLTLFTHFLLFSVYF